MDYKTCSACKESLTLEHFSRKGEDRLQSKCKACSRAYGRDHYKKNRRRYQETSNKNRPPQYAKHGLTEQGFIAMKMKFGGLCHLCREAPGTSIDHDHACCDRMHGCVKCVRGWLCARCNMGMSFFDKGPDWVARAVAYAAKN